LTFITANSRCPARRDARSCCFIEGDSEAVYADGGILGRDHYRDCYSVWMTGGAVKPGYVHGASDDLGCKVAHDMVHIHAPQATILHLLA